MLSISDIIYKGLKLSLRCWEATRRFSKRYFFVNRSKKSKYLILILAGYQEYVWDKVLDRIKKYAPTSYDICVVSPKIKSKKLMDICKNNQWSYFRLKANKLAIALNTAIKLHPNAEYIFKLDEDIFVGENFFLDMVKTYDYAIVKNEYKVGFVAPVMNINGASYNYFLDFIGIKNEYIEKFGNARITCDDDAVYKSGDAALYLWKKTLPLDDTVKSFSNQPIGYHQCSIRYSIGAILFKREFWQMARGFISPGNGELAWDEMCLCSYCINSSSSILICNNVFAGHFGFGPQKKFIIPLYMSKKNLF